jgi:hypothetical protein
MKRSKLGGKTRIPNSFDGAVHKTEWTCAAKVAEWINNLTKEKSLPWGQAEAETTQEGSRNRVDIILFESPASQRAICVIETKQPYFDVFDEEELKEPARKKATQRGAKYFATSNFQHLIWFDTEKANSLSPLEDQIEDKYPLSQIENLDLIEEPRYKNSLISGLEHFLTDLYEVHSGKKAKPKQAIDELLIYRLQDKVKRLSRHYITIIDNRCHKNSAFAAELARWFVSQGWSFAWQLQDFDKAARQTAYLLVNKILFYNVLQAKRPQQLDPLEVLQSLTKGAVLQTTLQGYFNQVLKIDYETIYTTDFIDSIAFPDDENVVKEIRELINILRQYDFSKLGYDIIGRVFERLIPQDERHNLGQYFTNPDVVDIILNFCLRHENDKVLDPACGAGTFLVRAYQYKKLRNENLVRFVYLFKPLRHFIPPAQEMWQEQKERADEIDKLRKTIMAHSQFYQNEDLRIFPKSQAELWREGFDPENGKYVGAKWGKYIRVKLPEIYLSIHQKGRYFFTKLQRVADVKPGCYTGINDFFYFERHPKYRDKMEKQFLIPVIRDTNQVKSMLVEPDNLETKAFVCRKTKERLEEEGKINALEYIKWGETQVTRRRQKVGAGIPWTDVETVKKRKPGWWAIPTKDMEPAQIFMIYVINERFIASLSRYPIASDRCFHRIFPSKGYDGRLLAAMLNSILTIFKIEVYGRSNLGLGALKFEAIDAKQIPIIDPKVITLPIQRELEGAFEKIKVRETGTIFSELGAPSPEEVSLNKVKSDRRELDKIVMGEILGLTDEEQLEVYRAVVDLVKSRIERAKSFGRRKKLREGIDVDALVKIVMDKIGNETIGKFYREKILSQESLSTRMLPKASGKIKIEQDLFGWKLSQDKKYLECHSLEEARYLKVFLEAGVGEVKIPQEDEYLEAVVPELEGLKAKIDEIINSYLESIINPKVKARIEHQLWAEVLK